MVSHLIEKCGVNRFIKELESRLNIGITYYYLEKLKPPSAEARIDKSKVGESYASTSLKTHRYQPYSTPHSKTPSKVPLKVAARCSNPPTPSPKSSTLFLEGLEPTTSEEALIHVFSKAGKVLEAKVHSQVLLQTNLHRKF